jgi:glutamate/tyrosine decarboxylase-like PLP-dependent enzyme
VVSVEAPADLAGLAEADSVAFDPHKWLYSALEAGCALVRHPGALRDAFSYSPPYYRFDGEAEDPRTNYFELGLQNSRGFRALKVWLGLRQAGRRGLAEMIGDDIRLARELHRLVAAHPRLEAWTLGLSITTFRYVPEDLEPGTEATDGYLNALNEDLLHRLKASGDVFVSNAVVRRTFLLRACVVNFRTTLADIEALPAIFVRHGEEADRALRPTLPGTRSRGAGETPRLPGGPGWFPTQGSHGSGLADVPHPARRVTGSLRAAGASDGPPAPGEGSAPRDARSAPTSCEPWRSGG